ncbi:hypothetical protein V3C99_002580 [Haemonchus contortus]
MVCIRSGDCQRRTLSKQKGDEKVDGLTFCTRGRATD